MFRLWGKILKNNMIVTDQVFELNAPDLSVNEKINKGMESLCYHFDIQKPMWFSDNTNDMTQIGKTRFMNHHFIEEIDFDYLEIDIIENKE